MKILIIIESILVIYLIYMLYKTRQKLQEIQNYQGDFFKSRQAELIFYLTQLEGKQRNKMLELKDEYYTNKELAKKWYKEIAKYVHPDKGGSNKAFSNLKKIYDILIEEDEDEE